MYSDEYPVVTAIEDNHHQLVQVLTIELKISWKSIYLILMGELGTERVCSILQMDKIQAREHACTKNLTMIINEREFLTQVITAEESWIHHYDPLLKTESSIWLHQGESRLKKVW